MKTFKITPYLYCAPVILTLLLLSYLPMPYGFYLSLHKTEMITGKSLFVGLDNFKGLLLDVNFWESFRNTFGYTVLSIIVLIVLGMLLALAFNNKIKFGAFYLAILFVPWITSEVVIGTTWKWLFNPVFGLLNYIFKPLGFEPSKLIIDPKYALFGLVIITVWKNIAYATIVILAGLQGISDELPEAAKIDGCSKLQSFRYIILPLLKSTLILLVILFFLFCMNQTGSILTLTNGGPLRVTETLSVYMYKEAFERYNLTNAASISVLLAIINLFFIGVFQRLGKNNQ